MYEIKKLKDCATIVAGQSPESKYYNTIGEGIPFFQGKADFGELYPKIRVFCTRPTKIAEKDDILLSVRAPVGPTNLSPGRVCIGRGLAAIRPSPEINLRYLLHYFRFFKAKLSAQGTGTTFKAITQATIKNLDVPVPPLSEQERITARIEELFSQLDASVAKLKMAKERLKVYRQAVLKEAFNQCKDYVPLSSLGDLGRGKSKHRPRNDPALFEGGKYPFIQTGDVKAAAKYITNYSKMYGPFGLQQSKLWPKGTLCITIAANIAETAFLGIDACFPDSVVGFTPQEKILPEYVRFFIESQKQRLWAFAPATAQKNINLDTLEKLMIPYCSLDKQAQIICETDSKITVCDNIEQTVDTALQQAEALRQSILKKAFEEELL